MRRHLRLYIDPDRADSHTATVDWGDGSPVQNATIIAGVGAGAIGGTHVYADDGNYTVTVSVTDNNDGSASQSFNVLVKNVPPVLVTATDQTLIEGQLLDLSASGGAPPLGLFVDPGLLDTHTATVNWGDGSATENATVIAGMGAGALGGSHTYADNGVYIVSVTVTDDDGGTSTGTFNVTVKNVAPFVDLTGPTSVDEGSPNNWNLGPIVDPGTDTVTQYIIHWGDGNTDTFTAAQIAGMGNTIGHTYADGPNSYTIAVDLVDEDGSFSSVDTLRVTVNNVPPVVDLTGPTSVNEGSPNSWDLGPIVDPGADTVTQYVIHWGDGNTDTFTAVEIAGMSGIVGHTYADGPNNYTIAVDLVDEDGTYLAVDTLGVAVNNVPPIVDLTGPMSVNEGAPNTWMLGAIVDPGSDAVSQYVIHWGDGNTDTFTATQIADMGNTIGHTYIEGPNNYTISVDLVDEDGTFLAVDTLSVTVNNVAPSVALNAVADISENSVATLTGSYTDIGVEDAQTVTVDWADENNSSPSTFPVPAIQDSVGTPTLSVGNTFSSSTDGAILTITSIDAATGQVGFSVQHEYLDDGLAPGNNTINDPSIIGVMVMDDDASSGSGSTTLTVHNAAPAVTLSAVPDINENGVATLTGSYTDIGLLDAHILTVNWADENNTLASTFAVNAIRNAAGTATLSVGDTFASSTDSAVLTITSINAAIGQVGFSVQHQYRDDGPAPGNGTTSDTSIIGVTVIDDDTQTGSNTTMVTVHNVAPAYLDVTGDSIDEGHVGTISLNVVDPGTLDVFTFNVDWRDGSTATIGGLGAADASGTVGATDFTWTAATRQLTLSHLYPDDADYQVVVRMADDDMVGNFGGAPSAGNYVEQTTRVAVANVAPTLAGTTNVMADEGSAVTLASLGVHIEDLGFDNPTNQTPPPLGNLTTEEFAAFSIDWGDGFSTTLVDVVGRVSGSAINFTTANPTTAQFMHDAHYFADDGVYVVTVRMADDNMGAFSNPALFTTGIAGVDYVDRQFEVLVKNVTPTLRVTSAASQQQTGSTTVTTSPVTPTTTITINESGTVSFAAGFTDPGFSLDENSGSSAGTYFPRNEIFRYYISWGDNRETVGEISAADVASLMNGGPTVLTSGEFDTTGMIHTYADDGTYTVTIRLADDNMGAFADTSRFADGVRADFGTNNGGDFVETTFTVVVNNIAPSFVPQPGGASILSTDVSSEGLTTINVAFSDPGFDNTANLNGPAPPTITDTLHESFTHVIDWGDGTVDAVHTYVDSSSHDVTITQIGPGGTQTFTVAGIGGANVLTLVSSQDINNPGAVAQPFTYVVDWGDGNVQTITLMLEAPGGPTVNGLTAVGSLVRTSGNVGVLTTGSFGITHQYLGPPDPLSPSDDIKITVSVVDDNNASVSDFVTITNPGIQVINVAIDTTPDVPRLVLAAQAAAGAAQPAIGRAVESAAACDSRRSK